MTVDHTLRKAGALARKGSAGEAADLYRAVLARFPGNRRAIDGLQALGTARSSQRRGPQPQDEAAQPLALYRQGAFAEALEKAEALLARHPDATLHNIAGSCHSALGRPEEAAACYRRALALSPDDVSAHVNLCEMLDRLNRVEDFRAALARARGACGDSDPRIVFRTAQLAARDNDMAGARKLLESMPDDGVSPTLAEGRLTLLGKTCDRLGDHAAAFDWIARANAHIATMPAARRCDPEAYLREVEDLAASFAGTQKPWLDARPSRERPPVFLVGFPRSGTTLLDTILRSHPKIAVAEEKPMAVRMQAMLGGPPDVDRLAALGADEITALREAYFGELSRHLGNDDDPDRVIVDKLPLNIVRAGLIRRVFPNATFIFAARHPCDCVLSCFMQNFRLNNAMANFLDLESGAILYDRVMRLWSAYRAMLAPKVHVLRYEDLVADLEGAVRPLIAFMELGWDDRMLDYRETALTRGRINTPSYSQVTEKLYARASGRWENYRARFEPVLPLLEPWAKAAGY